MIKTDNDNGTSVAASMVSVAGVIGGLALLVGIVVVSHKSNWLRRSTQGQLDSLTVAMKSDVFADPARYAWFCRSVSFHGLRYNREFMSISNTNLMMVYDLLLLERPKASDLEPLRTVCTQFLQKDVTRDPPHYIDRSVGFFQESLADVILEELLDIYVQADRVTAQQQQQHQRFERGCSEYAAEYGALGGPVYKEAVSLSLYDHLGGGPKMLHDHFYEAIDEYLVGKRCVEPGSYAALSDTDPVYGELVLLTAFYQGGNRRPLTSMTDAEYCVIDTEYSVIKAPDGDNHSDSGGSVYRLATPHDSAIYEIADFDPSAVYGIAPGDAGDRVYGGVYDNAGDGGGGGGQHDAAVYGDVYDNAGDGGGDDQYGFSTVSGGVYDNKLRPEAEDRVNIVYETAEAVSASRCDSAVYEIAKIMSRSSGTVGERGTAANTGGAGTSHTERATPKQRKDAAQFAVGVPLAEQSSIFLRVGNDLQVPAVADTAEQPAEQTSKVPSFAASPPISEVRLPSRPLHDGTVVLDMTRSELLAEKADLEQVLVGFDCRFKPKPSNNNQLTADATIGELPAYEEPDYIHQETINMNDITSEAHFGSRSDALISAIDDTIVLDRSTVAQEENVGMESDFAAIVPDTYVAISVSSPDGPAQRDDGNMDVELDFSAVTPDAYVAVGQVEDGDYCDIESVDSCDEALYDKLNTRRSTSPGNLPPSSPEGGRIARRTLRVPTDPLPAEPPGYTRPPDFLTP